MKTTKIETENDNETPSSSSSCSNEVVVVMREETATRSNDDDDGEKDLDVAVAVVEMQQQSDDDNEASSLLVPLALSPSSFNSSRLERLKSSREHQSNKQSKARSKRWNVTKSSSDLLTVDSLSLQDPQQTRLVRSSSSLQAATPPTTTMTPKSQLVHSPNSNKNNSSLRTNVDKMALDALAQLSRKHSFHYLLDHRQTTATTILPSSIRKTRANNNNNNKSTTTSIDVLLQPHPKSTTQTIQHSLHPVQQQQSCNNTSTSINDNDDPSDGTLYLLQLGQIMEGARALDAIQQQKQQQQQQQSCNDAGTTTSSLSSLEDDTTPPTRNIHCAPQCNVAVHNNNNKRIFWNRFFFVFFTIPSVTTVLFLVLVVTSCGTTQKWPQSSIIQLLDYKKSNHVCHVVESYKSILHWHLQQQEYDDESWLFEVKKQIQLVPTELVLVEMKELWIQFKAGNLTRYILTTHVFGPELYQYLSNTFQSLVKEMMRRLLPYDEHHSSNALPSSFTTTTRVPSTIMWKNITITSILPDDDNCFYNYMMMQSFHEMPGISVPKQANKVLSIHNTTQSCCSSVPGKGGKIIVPFSRPHLAATMTSNKEEEEEDKHNDLFHFIMMKEKDQCIETFNICFSASQQQQQNNMTAKQRKLLEEEDVFSEQPLMDVFVDLIKTRQEEQKITKTKRNYRKKKGGWHFFMALE